MRAKIFPAVFLILVLLVGFPSSVGNFSAFADEDDDNDNLRVSAEESKAYQKQKEKAEKAREKAEERKEKLKEKYEREIKRLEEKVKKQEEKFKEQSERKLKQLEEKAKRLEEKYDDKIKKFGTNVDIDYSSASPTDRTITICHYPPGNPENAQTITVAKSSVRAHLAHGDIVGECSDDPELRAEERNARLAEKHAKLQEQRYKLEQKQIEKVKKYFEKLESKYLEKQQALTDKYALKQERLAVDLAKLEEKYAQKSEELQQKLSQKINQLDTRTQKLVEKFNRGEYFGELEDNDVARELVLRFDSLTGESYADSSASSFVADITLETSSSAASGHQKFVVSGCEIIGEDVSYHCAFGKARIVSSGTGSNNALDIMTFLQDDDSDANSSLRAHIVPTDSSTNWFEGTSDVTIHAKISLQWSLSGDGTITVFQPEYEVENNDDSFVAKETEVEEGIRIENDDNNENNETADTTDETANTTDETTDTTDETADAIETIDEDDENEFGATTNIKFTSDTSVDNTADSTNETTDDTDETADTTDETANTSISTMDTSDESD